MNWEDPIVREVREFRDQLSAEHGNDLRALCKYLQEREQLELVTRDPQTTPAGFALDKRCA